MEKYTEHPPVLIQKVLDVKLYREPMETPAGTSCGFSDVVVAVLNGVTCTISIPLKEGHLACKKYGGWWRWILVSSPDGVAPIRMVGVSTSCT